MSGNSVNSDVFAGISEGTFEVASVAETPLAPRNNGAGALVSVPELDLGKDPSFQSNEKVQQDLKLLDKDIVKLQSSIHSLLSAHT